MTSPARSAPLKTMVMPLVLPLLLLAACTLSYMAAPPTVHAHETRPAYIEVTEQPPARQPQTQSQQPPQSPSQIWSVLWKSPTLGDPPIYLHPVLGDTPLENLPGNCTEVSGGVSSGATLCRWEIQAGAASLAGQRIAIDGLAGTSTDALVRVNFADGTSVTRLLRPEAPSWTIVHSGQNSVSAAGFFRMGVEHILYGIDHLLFVLLLLLIVEKGWVLVKTVTAFTVAHTITLGLAVLGLVRVTPAPVEAVIALSIPFLAVELAHHIKGQDGLTYRAPWIVAFSFGLLHGFGFAGTLASVGLPQAAIPKALFFFNVGVEAGQLAFIAVCLSFLYALRRLEIRWPAWSRQVPAYAIGSLAALWFLQRCAAIFS